MKKKKKKEINASKIYRPVGNLAERAKVIHQRVAAGYHKGNPIISGYIQ